MRVPVPLTKDFGEHFQQELETFAIQEGLIPESEPSPLTSKRYLSRSVAPHVEKLSALFNRRESAPPEDGHPPQKGAIPEPVDPSGGLDKYWKSGSNPKNLRLAYFLAFMPPNLFRVAAVWSELGRLGFRWAAGDRLRAIELGAGPATASCGIIAGEKHASIGLPSVGDFALIEQDRGMLELGSRWARRYFADHGLPDLGTRTFHWTLNFKEPLLPRAAPKFNLWLSSYFLNETREPTSVVADRLIDAWNRHLDDEGIVILVEPALRLQSRRLLELRRELIARSGLQVLLPCLGHQNCGALADSEDWCHEEVSWWRPPYLKLLDEMTRLDRKSLPFSYLVLVKSKRDRRELLPAIDGKTQRLVSPAHREGKEWEFYLCGDDGKRRARYRPSASENEPLADPERGDILIDPELRGDMNSARIERLRRKA